MTKKEAEEKLKALMQQEKNLQDKLRKVDAASPEKPEKVVHMIPIMVQGQRHHIIIIEHLQIMMKVIMVL